MTTIDQAAIAAAEALPAYPLTGMPGADRIAMTRGMDGNWNLLSIGEQQYLKAVVALLDLSRDIYSVDGTLMAHLFRLADRVLQPRRDIGGHDG